MDLIERVLLVAVLPALASSLELGLALGVGLLLLRLIRARALVIPRHAALPYVMLVMYVINTMAVYALAGVSLSHTILYFLTPLLFFLVGSNAGRIDQRPFLILLLVVFLMIVALFLFRDVHNQLTWRITEFRILYRGRASLRATDLSESFFIQNNTSMAVYFMTPLILSLVLYRATGSMVYILVASLSATSLFLLNTRVAYLATLVILGVFVLRGQDTYRQMARRAAALVVLALFVGVVGYLFVMEYQEYFAIQMARLTGEGVEQSLELRMRLFWATSFQEFLSNPWGHGHRFYYDRYGFSTHNEYLGQLVSVGLIGTIFYAAFMITTLTRAMKLSKSATADVQMLAAVTTYMLLAYSIIGLTDQVTVSATRWVAFMFMIVGMFYGTAVRARPDIDVRRGIVVHTVPDERLQPVAGRG